MAADGKMRITIPFFHFDELSILKDVTPTLCACSDGEAKQELWMKIFFSPQYEYCPGVDGGAM